MVSIAILMYFLGHTHFHMKSIKLQCWILHALFISSLIGKENLVKALQFNFGSSTTKPSRSSNFRFSRPLLTEGYPAAVIEFENDQHLEKPVLLYLPGFDGTLVCPFLQFPELSTEFDVHGLTIEMSDRSTFEELIEGVVRYLDSKCLGRKLFLMGESFGGVLAAAVALELQETLAIRSSSLEGLVMINPATSYKRSNLYERATPVAQLGFLQYIFGLLELLPMFVDKYQFPQLLLMLSSEALPSVIDTDAREAYMGRTAFSLGEKLKFMPRDTLAWRLEEWLEKGCCIMTKERLRDLSKYKIESLIVVGEKDETLPSVDEAYRLEKIIDGAKVHIV